MKSLWLALSMVFVVTITSQAGIVVQDPCLKAFLRSDAVQPFPLAVDSSANLYTVTGTSTSDAFVRIAPNNSVTVLNGGVGAVVGVFSDLEVGFGGDLFANAASIGSNSHGVVRFDHTTGASSFVYSAPGFNADGGLAFDPINQVLYELSQGGGDLVAINSLGSASIVATGLAPALGMSFGADGNLKIINGQDIFQFDPSTRQVSTLIDFASSLPGFSGAGIATDPLNGDLLFVGGPVDGISGGLLRANQDGSNISVVATYDSGFLGVAAGPRGDGLSGRSIYVSDPHSSVIFELRPVPEPSTISMLAVGLVAVAFKMIPSRRNRSRLK